MTTRGKKERIAESEESTPTKSNGDGGESSKKLKPSPTSAIKSGMKGSLKKDNANKLFIQGCKGGVVTAYVQKPSAVEEPFLAYDYTLIRENEDIAVQMEINEIVHRRDQNGNAMSQRRGGEHAWRQFLMIVGEDGNNAENRKRLADNIISFLNRNATSANYTWPKGTKFGGDLTKTPMGAMDTLLLDKDVFKVMKIAYPDLTIAELAGFPEICGNFFTTVDNNRFALMSTWEESNSA